MPKSVTRGRASGVNFRAYVEGGPQLAAALAKLGKGMRDELLVQATAAGAEVIADEWRAQIASKIGRGPGTAHYVDAVGIRAKPGKNGATAWVGLPTDVPTSATEDHPRKYAPLLEFGGYKRGYIQARPTLRPAFEASKQKALDAMTAVIARLLKTAS